MERLIIFLSIVFVIDICCTVIQSKNLSTNILMLQIFRISLLYPITLILILSFFDLKEKAEGKCPEYEKIENVYKLKL